MTRTATFTGIEGRKMAPTKQHRPAIWENMLGTVWALNDEGHARYFDYDWNAAAVYAGVAADRDPRIAKKTRNVRYSDSSTNDPRLGQPCLWITKRER